MQLCEGKECPQTTGKRWKSQSCKGEQNLSERRWAWCQGGAITYLLCDYGFCDISPPNNFVNDLTWPLRCLSMLSSGE